MLPEMEDMCWIKGMFWDAEEVVVQFHPPASEYVNNHGCDLPPRGKLKLSEATDRIF
jgi:hypothetical protein